MARISEKALRPRQYVFNRLSAERIARLTSGVRKLQESERRQSVNTRAAARAADRHVAARHAENIMAGLRHAVAETDEIGVLEKELEELRRRKRDLFEMLRKSLGADSHAIAHGDESGVAAAGASSMVLADAADGAPEDLRASADQSPDAEEMSDRPAAESATRTD